MISVRSSVATEKQAPLLNINDVQLNTQRHNITIGRTVISLTPSEFRLFFPLRHGTPVTYEQLAEEAYHYIPDEKVRVMMDKHIDRIRGKIRGTGIYIFCVLGYGYMLLPVMAA